MSALPPKADIETQPRNVFFVPIGDIMPCPGSRASRPQMHRRRSGQRCQNKEHEAGPIGHHRNNDEPYAVPTGRSFDGKGDANDEERRR